MRQGNNIWCFLIFQRYQLQLLSTHDAGIKVWFKGFTVMPKSGEVVMSGSEDEDASWSLFVFSLKDEKSSRKKINSSCGHKGLAFTAPLIIAGREKLVVSCWKCDDLKLLDLQTGEWSTAFKDCAPANLCPGGSGTIFLQSWRDQSILQLDSTGPVFKGLLKTLHTDMWCLAMCYIPPPVNALVVSDFLSSKMVALSVESGGLMWEFQRQEGGVYYQQKRVVYDRSGLLFHPEHNVLFVADGIRKRVLAVDPGTGGLIQTIDLPEMGAVYDLYLYKDQIVMLRKNEDIRKISYFNLV